ncbi:MAG: hypothetical protein L0Z68_02065 [Gammaproteobacteria bacterium]|nr:hypothetical protein [Gammaproteobacteria bacterium]
MAVLGEAGIAGGGFEASALLLSARAALQPRQQTSLTKSKDEIALDQRVQAHQLYTSL